jgi:hypothetical protein
MTWQLTGRMVEGCSCNMLCPCWIGVKELMVTDKGYCSGTMLLRIQSGNSDGIDLSGREVVMATDFPGPTVFDGNGTARLYIDDGSNDTQRRALEDIIQGRKGGPMQILSQLVKWLPTATAKIDVNDDGHNLTAIIAGFGEMRSQELKNEAGRTMSMQGAGFASVFQYENEIMTLAPSSNQWTDKEMPREFSTKSGTAAKFSWRGN